MLHGRRILRLRAHPAALSLLPFIPSHTFPSVALRREWIRRRAPAPRGAARLTSPSFRLRSPDSLNRWSVSIYIHFTLAQNALSTRTCPSRGETSHLFKPPSAQLLTRPSRSSRPLSLTPTCSPSEPSRPSHSSLTSRNVCGSSAPARSRPVSSSTSLLQAILVSSFRPVRRIPEELTNFRYPCSLPSTSQPQACSFLHALRSASLPSAISQRPAPRLRRLDSLHQLYRLMRPSDAGLPGHP